MILCFIVVKALSSTVNMLTVKCSLDVGLTVSAAVHKTTYLSSYLLAVLNDRDFVCDSRDPWCELEESSFYTFLIFNLRKKYKVHCTWKCHCQFLQNDVKNDNTKKENREFYFSLMSLIEKKKYSVLLDHR